MLGVLLLSLLSAEASAQLGSCDAELTGVRLCQRRAFAATRDHFRREVEPAVEACFAEAGCESPLAASVDRLFSCRSSIARRFFAPVIFRHCESLSGFSPEDLVVRLVGQPGAKAEGEERATASHLSSVFCSNASAAKAAQQCVEAVMSEAYEPVAEGPDQCATLLSKPCREKYDNAEANMCSCAESAAADVVAAAGVKASLNACLPAELKLNPAPLLQRMKAKVCSKDPVLF